MASFNSAPSVFPRQAVVASATLPPQTPVPSFFGGNTTTVSPATPVANTPATPVVTPPAPPADTFTPTAPAPVATTAPAETPQTSTALAPNTATAPEATDAQKAEDAKKENGFMKFAKSPWGIGTGVLLAGSAVTALVLKMRQGGSPLVKLEKVVKDLGIDDLDSNPDHKLSLLQKFGEHLQGLTANTTEHTPETWDKLSSAIVDVHAKHGSNSRAQSHLLRGLGDSTPDALLQLSAPARKAIFETSTAYIDGITKVNLAPEEATFHAPLVGKAAEWLLHPHGEIDFGIRNENDLAGNVNAIAIALYKVRPEGEHLSDIHKAVLGFSGTDEHLSQLKLSLNPLKDDEGVALTDINDIRTAGHALFNARLKGPKETEEVLAHLNAQGIDEGYGALSKPDGFKELQALLLPKPESEEKKFPQRVLSFFPDVIFSLENRQKSEVFRIGRFVRDTWNNVTTKKTTE
ncbi:MAG: hypothetical protein ACK5T0_10315 [Vampirovibrionales bacterium]